MSSSNVIFFEREIVHSPAFLALTGVSAQVLFLFLARRKMGKVGSRRGKESWAITNNGEIVFPYSQAVSKFGITKPRFQRALRQLIEFGFLDINHHGGGLVKDCTTYFISDRWKKYGKEVLDISISISVVKSNSSNSILFHLNNHQVLHL